MPVIENSSYRAPWYLFNGHLQTIVPFWLDKKENDLYETERLELPDGDFLDLDWLRSDANRLMILSHGLEGNSRSYYIKHTAKYFSTRGWDVMAWNFRGCSRELNRLPKFYYAGETQDLSAVVDHCLATKNYTSVVLVGFSIGGSMTLKYAGTHTRSEKIKTVVTFSVPCDAKSAEEQLENWSGRIYAKKFLQKLLRKIERAAVLHPDRIVVDKTIKTLTAFNERYTVPLHCFRNLAELHESSSCLHAIEKISIPTLIVNAKNDPVIGVKSYPIKEAEKNPFVFLEMPKHGGHAGFSLAGKDNFWIGGRIEQFLSTLE